MKPHYDVIIIGAGAAGLFCAFNAAARDKRVLVLDHANKVGKKILMSGGGRCNFTNLNTTHENFSSQNPHFCKSALSQYTAYDFLALVEKHNIEYVEKEPGQLFCKHSSKDILQMLLQECAQGAVKIYKKCSIEKIQYTDQFDLDASCGEFTAESLVIASGGLSIPTLGATGFGYEIAKQFGHTLVETSAALVPFVLSQKWLTRIKPMAGVALPVRVSCDHNGKAISISNDMLFTHRGLSGPAILKLSSHWLPGMQIHIDLLPAVDIRQYISEQMSEHAEQLLVNNLAKLLPKKVAGFICELALQDKKLKQLTKTELELLEQKLHHWDIRPEGTEGYRTAEVTAGGVSTDKISSRTFESALQKKLYFIGEVLDVTGELGGYNFQWAWSSAWCAANSL
ncbi:MAG TPA: NAD(P)/FAD-dependent oxidoreductase [Gammaproteobacteria bacterium]